MNNHWWRLKSYLFILLFIFISQYIERRFDLWGLTWKSFVYWVAFVAVMVFSGISPKDEEDRERSD